MSKKDGGKCISTNAKETTTSSRNESISEGFQTLLRIFLNTLEILITTIQGLGARHPRSASSKICSIKIW